MRRKRADDDSVPLGLWPDYNRLGVDPIEYGDLVRRYEKVEYDSLVAEYEQGHVPGRKKLLRLDQGVHKMKQIFITSQGGYVSFEAMEWCAQQDITVFLLNWKNDVVQVLTPRQNRNARLVYLQYKASGSQQGVDIARELVRCKTEQQIAAVKQFPDHPIVEGRVLLTKGRRAVRVSGISSNGYVNQATNPFFAVLNFAYALLKAQVLQSILIHGLDETIGFLHVLREGNQAFVYDLMEPFRSLVGTSVLNIFDKTIFTRSDFIQTIDGECRLNEGLRHHIVAKCRVSNRDTDQFVEKVLDIIIWNTH